MYSHYGKSSVLTSRIYRSPQREAAAAETRERILSAAATLLSQADGISRFSLDSVAKAAAITRLTVYNQFGSRAALLEAVLDRLALGAGLARIPEAMADEDPQSGLRRLIGIFCDFWAHDHNMVACLHAVGAKDQEFSDAVNARNERRRRTFSVLVNRLTGAGCVRSTEAGELVDVLFALTSFSFFAELSADGRPAGVVCRLIQNMAADAVKRAGTAKTGARRNAR